MASTLFVPLVTSVIAPRICESTDCHPEGLLQPRQSEPPASWLRASLSRLEATGSILSDRVFELQQLLNMHACQNQRNFARRKCSLSRVPATRAGRHRNLLVVAGEKWILESGQHPTFCPALHVVLLASRLILDQMARIRCAPNAD